VTAVFPHIFYKLSGGCVILADCKKQSKNRNRVSWLVIETRFLRLREDGDITEALK
jgi:hypothetical protein